MSRNRNVYVLGAGFSADAGVPTMPKFFHAARQYYDSPLTTVPNHLQEHYERVLEFRQRASRCRDAVNLDLDNIEVLFSLIDMAQALATDGDSGGSESIKHLISHTVQESRRPTPTAEIWIKKGDFASLPHRAALDPYRDPERSDKTRLVLEMPVYEFAAALFCGAFEPREHGCDDAVVTFNYDTVLEEAVWAIGAQVDYSARLTRKVGPRVQKSNRWKLPIHKLHGSSNWAYVGKKRTRAHIYDSYSEFSELHVPVLVPPTWKKGDLPSLLTEAWQHAHAALSNATQICVIGYSMPATDAFFHHLMASSLMENPALYELHLVDRDILEPEKEDGVPGRFKRLFRPLVGYKRFRFHGSGLLGFLSSPSRVGRGHAIDMVQITHSNR